MGFCENCEEPSSYIKQEIFRSTVIVGYKATLIRKITIEGLLGTWRSEHALLR